MPDPLRSPKQSRVTAKNRSHPYARPANLYRTRDTGLERSNSLLGSITSFITAPFSWLSFGDSQESNDNPQKRRVSGSERHGSPPRSKRPRRYSPEVAGHLDPPSSLFPPSKPPVPVWNNSNRLTSARTMSLDALPLPDTLVAAPQPPSRGHSMLFRTSTSVEPQTQHPLRRSMTRELSMPPPSPFARSYTRSSLTPQPSGATFGPSPKRRPRESTAPPLLSSPTPKFTRPPTPSADQNRLFPRSQSREMSEDPVAALLGRNRQSVSPMRESPSRSLLSQNEVPIHTPGKTSVEQTLSALESYRTPLHASRFPAASLSDKHRPRKVHVPTPSKLRFDHTPEGRKKAKNGPTIVGPYSSGMSGMRKLLARRREDLEREAKEKEASSGSDVVSDDPNKVTAGMMGIEADEALGETKETEAEKNVRKTYPQENGITTKDDGQLPRARSPPRSKPNGPYSSLRAPSNRLNRTHALAPKLKKAKNKFGLDEEEDAEWSMSVDDVKSYHAQAPQSPLFSPVRRMSETGMQTDTDNPPLRRLKTPPLPSQPQTFDSLLSRIGSSTPPATKLVATFPATPSSPPKDVAGLPRTEPTKLEDSSAPAELPFSLGGTSVQKHVEVGTSPFSSNVTTPAPSPSPAPAPPTLNGAAMPSFFANTTRQFTPPAVPSGSLFGGSTPAIKKNDTAEQPTVVAFDDAKKTENSGKPGAQGQTLALFGGPSKPSTLNSLSVSPFSGETPKNVIPEDTSADKAFQDHNVGTSETVSSSETPKPAFSFGAPAGGATVSTPSISIFGAASRADVGSSTPAETSTKSIFSSPVVATTMPSVGKPLPSTSADAVQTSLGAPISSTEPTNAAATKSPFSFGAAPSTPPPADKQQPFTFGNQPGAVPAFSFGSNNMPASTVSGPSSETPKPAFSAFGNTSVSSVSKLAESVTEGGDGMEVNGGDRMEESPTRSLDRKDVPTPTFASFGAGTSTGGFSFGQTKPSVASGAFTFGDPKPPVSTGFAFGSSSAAKPTTSADTSTGFAFGQNANKASGTTPSSTGFAFGSDTSKSTQLTFGAPLNTSFGGSSTSNPTSTGFSFGQPNSSVTANVFGQPPKPEASASGAPTSPSPFTQQALQPSQSPSPQFSFTVPPSNAFPAPNGAAGPSAGAPTQPFQFGASGTTQQQPGASGGNAMFTLGGAATPPRKVKGLPTRRGRRA